MKYENIRSKKLAVDCSWCCGRDSKIDRDGRLWQRYISSILKNMMFYYFYLFFLYNNTQNKTPYIRKNDVIRSAYAVKFRQSKLVLDEMGQFCSKKYNSSEMSDKPKSILKRPGRKSQPKDFQFDEQNVLETFHPANKDYG